MCFYCMCVCFQVEAGLVVGCGGIPPQAVDFFVVLCTKVVCCSLRVPYVSHWVLARPGLLPVGGRICGAGCPGLALVV
jgi:hypothetical protein